MNTDGSVHPIIKAQSELHREVVSVILAEQSETCASRGAGHASAGSVTPFMTLLIEPEVQGTISGDATPHRRRVMVPIAYYLPGMNSGGPIQSIANMIAQLSPSYDFYVVARNRDIGESVSYSDIIPNQWYRVGAAHVLYCSSIGPSIFKKLFQEIRPDVIYLTSFQDVFTRIFVVMRRCGVFGNTPMILVPRGEFSPESMKIKRKKKAIYRSLTKWAGLHDNLLWQASTAREKRGLLKAAPARRLNPDSVHVVHNISNVTVSSAPHPAKEPGGVRLAFISRMSEMKNLHFLLEVLREVRGAVCLNLYGPAEGKDVAYWNRCKAQLAQLPANINVEYHGQIDHSAVSQVLHDHHFFVLPTKGENFCHAAVESFINGTPVVVSDETPWVGLKGVHAGFDIPLQDRKGWIDALQTCVDMDQSTFQLYLGGAETYGGRFSVREAVEQHRSMFEAAFSNRPCVIDSTIPKQP